MNKQVLITAFILTLFAMIGGGLVSFTEQSTAEQIRIVEKQRLQKSLNTILPASSYDNDLTRSTLALPASDLLGTKTESIAYFARKAGKTTAFIFNVVANNGYNGNIYLLIGINVDGEVIGVRVVQHKETPGLGDAIEERRSDWILGFNQQSLNTLNDKQWKVKRDGGYFDQFTGATITPRAVVQAVHQTLLYFKQHADDLIKLSTNTKPGNSEE